MIDAQIKFLLYLEAQGRSYCTVESYRIRLKGLMDYLGDVPIAGITPHDLDNYIVSLRRRKTRYDLHPTRPQCDGGLAVATLSGRLRDIKTFFRWCVQRGLIPHSPAEHLKIPKYDPSATNRAMALTDLQRMLREAEHNPRDLALVMFLADTGARVGEIACITLDRLDLDNGEASVHGKTGTRTIDFTAQTSGALQAYLLRRRSTSNCTFLWLGKNGQPLTAGGVYQVLKRLAKRAGITGRFNPHAIRHAVGQTWTDSGVNLEMIRRKLGHASVETTARYYTNQDRQREKLATVANSLIKKIKIDD